MTILLALSALAVVVWTTPTRKERALHNASLDELRNAEANDPNNPRILYYLGKRLRESGNSEGAYTVFKRAALQDNDGEDVWLGWADAAALLGNRAEAFGILRTYLKDHPNSGRAHFALALLYHKEALSEKAREEALAATRLLPHESAAWLLAGLCAAESEDYSQAETILTDGFAQNPNDGRLALALGNALSLQRRDDKALPYYQQATRLLPDDPAVLFGLGRAQLMTAKTSAEVADAQTLLLRAAERLPDAAPVYRALGESYLRRQNWPEARQALEKAARLAPYHPAVHYDLRQVYQQLGDTARAAQEAQRHRQALDYFNEKRRLSARVGQVKDEPETWLKLARLYATHGDYAEAIRAYRQLLAVTPNLAAAKQELTALESAHPDAASTTLSLPALPNE